MSKISGTALLKKILFYKSLPNLYQKNRKNLLPALLGTSTNQKNSVMKGWKYKEAFKSYFFHWKSNKKSDRICKFSSTLITIGKRCLYLLFQNQCPHFLLPPPFWKLSCANCLRTQVRINKMLNKHLVDYHPSLSQLTSRIHPLIFLLTHKGFISSESFLNFS